MDNKRKRGPVGEYPLLAKWELRISKLMNSLGPVNSPLTKKLKVGKQLDSPDILPIRFTSRNSSGLSDSTLEECDILNTSFYSQSPISTPKELTARPQHNHNSPNSTYPRDAVAIASDNSESDDDFEQLMSRRIAREEIHTANEAVALPKAASEASEAPVAKPEGSENKVECNTVTGRRPTQKTLQQKIAVKCERAHTQERAAESAAALGQEQLIKGSKAEPEVARRDPAVKSRASAQHPGTKQNTTEIVKASANSSVRDNVTSGNALAAAEETHSHYDEPIVPFIGPYNPSKGSPIVATKVNTSQLEAMRRSYAARVSNSATAASERAALLSKSLGTESVRDIVPLKRTCKPSKKSANAAQKRVTFEDTLTERRSKDVYPTSTGRSPTAHQLGEKPKSRKRIGTCREPGHTTFSHTLADQRPKDPRAPGQQEDGMEVLGGCARIQDAATEDNLIARASSGQGTQRMDDTESPRRLEKEILQEPGIVIAEVGQESRVTKSLAVGYLGDGREAPKPMEKRGSSSQRLTNRQLAEDIPGGHEERTTEGLAGHESGGSEVSPLCPSANTLEEQGKTITKKSVAKRKKYSVSSETYWEYRVIRTTWRDDTDPPLQHHCGTYFDRQSANNAARDQVFPPSAAADPLLYDEYHKEKDAFNMDLYSAQSARGHILVFTQRVLICNPTSIAANKEAKGTWLNPKVYVVWEKYVEYDEPGPDNDLFGEKAKEREVKSITSIMLGIHTTRHFANKAASDHSIEWLRRSAMKNGRTSAQSEVAIIELEMQSREHLKALEEEKDLYNSEIEVMGTRNELSVWVDEVDLIGPRN